MADGIPSPFLDGIWVRHLRGRMEAAKGTSNSRLERYARDLLRVQPDDIQALLSLAESLHRQGRFDLAFALLRFARLAHPNNPEITPFFDRLSALHPSETSTHADSALLLTLQDNIREYALQGDLAGIRSIEDQLNDLFPRFRANEAHLDALAAAYRELDEPSLECSVLIELLTHRPQRLDAIRRLAELLKRMDCGRVMRAVLASLPDSSAIAGFDATAGAALAHVGYPAEAVQYYSRWVESSPKNGDAWAALGMGLFEAGDLDRSRAALIKASTMTPRLQPIYTTLAHIAAERRDPDDALIWLRRLRPLLTDQELADLLMAPSFTKIPEVLYQLR